jgi:hypothetical protein
MVHSSFLGCGVDVSVLSFNMNGWTGAVKADAFICVPTLFKAETGGRKPAGGTGYIVNTSWSRIPASLAILEIPPSMPIPRFTIFPKFNSIQRRPGGQ